MTMRPVMVALRTPPPQMAAGMEFSLSEASAPDIPGLEVDTEFGAIPMPRPLDPGSPGDRSSGRSGLEASLEPETPPVASYIVRGMMDDEAIDEARAQEDVIEVFADVPIEPFLICPGSPPLGTDADVERLLCTTRLHGAGADGSGVLVAIVDTGVNMAYLNGRGKTPNFDMARSWVPRAGLTPGSLPVGHGTMCAYDVCIAAPRCTILDIALLTSNATGGSAMAGLLSDAVRAYNHLIGVMNAPRQPGESRSLVVNNSWGMFHPSWDFPVGNPGNYSDNPNHPFNLIVGTLESMGADILFAAGNCGANCPDGRCQSVTRAIYGANSHPRVLSVAGVDTTKQRVGYSTQGPGRLTANKPDLCGFTHFAGSGVYAADGGTSAACPVVAGLVAAYRTRRPFQPGNPSVSPNAVRNLLRSTCEDLGTAGFDLDHGFGVVRGCAIADNLRLREPVPNLCALIPRLCGPVRVPIDICERYPDLCRPRIPIPGRPDIVRQPLPGGGRGLSSFGDGSGFATLDLGSNAEALDQLSREQLAELLYIVGYMDAVESQPQPGARGEPPPQSGKCGCRCG